jgi:hypothetical protein
MSNEPSQGPLIDATKEIEAFAERVIGFVADAVLDGGIAGGLVPEALMLATVEVAASQDGDSERVVEWLTRIAARIREANEPASP